jgi:GNAT superfamily N-acetyltransferase
MMQDFYAESGHTLDCAAAESSFRTSFRTKILEPHSSPNDDETIGYAVITFRFSMSSGGYDAVLDDIFVVPNARRQGVGSGLLNAILPDCSGRNIRAITVESARDSEATRLYKRFGFCESLHTHLSREIGTGMRTGRPQ